MALGIYNKVALPHAVIPRSIFLVVEQALRLAWELTLKSPRFGVDLNTAHEDIVTHELYETLMDKVFKQKMVAGFDNQLFTCVERETKKRSFDYGSLDKMPDFLFQLVGRNVSRITQDGIFVECKPVDDAHAVGKHYCDKGIIRFVNGEYAWTMTSALMIGYARKNFKIIPKLQKALQKRPTMAIPGSLKVCSAPASVATKYSQRVYISEHTRVFCYQETGQNAPAIVLRHLWLEREP